MALSPLLQILQQPNFRIVTWQNGRLVGIYLIMRLTITTPPLSHSTDISSVIRQKNESQTEVTRKRSKKGFLKNKHFLPLDLCFDIHIFAILPTIYGFISTFTNLIITGFSRIVKQHLLNVNCR